MFCCVIFGLGVVFFVVLWFEFGLCLGINEERLTEIQVCLIFRQAELFFSQSEIWNGLLLYATLIRDKIYPPGGAGGCGGEYNSDGTEDSNIAEGGYGANSGD